jgi:hypothetical protein
MTHRRWSQTEQDSRVLANLPLNRSKSSTTTFLKPNRQFNLLSASTPEEELTFDARNFNWLENIPQKIRKVGALKQ